MTINKFLYKLYMLIYDRSIIPEGLMLIRQANQNSVVFVTIGIFLDKMFKLQPHVCNWFMSD